VKQGLRIVAFQAQAWQDDAAKRRSHTMCGRSLQTREHLIEIFQKL
jgi:hypothetical protein